MLNFTSMKNLLVDPLLAYISRKWRHIFALRLKPFVFRHIHLLYEAPTTCLIHSEYSYGSRTKLEECGRKVFINSCDKGTSEY